MYLWPLLLSNLHLGMDAPINPDLSVGNFGNLDNLGYHSPTRFFNTPYIFWKLLNHNKVFNTVNVDNDIFKITMKVQQYKPEEITVKVVDRWLIIKASHENRTNVGSQQFEMRYVLPFRADVDQMTSSISSDGILTITAPLKPMDEKVIPIKQTGQPATSNSAGQPSTKPANEVDVEQIEIATEQAAAEEAGTEQAGEGQIGVGQV